MDVLTVEKLQNAVKAASMLRIRLSLDASGAGGLVYPPTYDQGQHIFRPAWIDGQKREAVLLDSVQSQANRIEQAILNAHERGDIRYPDIRISIDAKTGHEDYSVLQLSHRIFDAALRACQVEGTLFPQTEIGKAVTGGRPENATPLFVHAPLVLVLGGWDSHGGGGPLVAKLPRLLTSEIIGLDACPVDRAATKFDPMDIRKAAGPVFESKDPERLYETDKKLAAAGTKEKKPSEIGLGSVPSMEKRGAVITEAIQVSTITLSGVRRLRFPLGGNGKRDDARDAAGQVASAALGLYGLLAEMEDGYNLRSGCDLLPRTNPIIEIIGNTLNEIESFSLSTEQARKILLTTLEHANAHGLSWRDHVINATADERLRTLVERSRLSKPEAGD